MSHCILLGKPNVGKTSFFLSFMEYLGVNEYTFELTNFNEEISLKTYTLNTAKAHLISSSPFKTKEIYKANLSIPVYKGSADFLFLDTSGLIDGISKDDKVRLSMALTLKNLYTSSIILHMIDTSSVLHNKMSTLSEIDYQINEYGKLTGSYCILASKMDLSTSVAGFKFLEKEFNDTYVIPISSIKKTGFKEVKKFVARNL
ncbi:MAG: 50S ribosome-binding GTPase [Clostridiaceae bacterium]|nr:50S ribosome-binding GTPase [Clostridiaceae bacterium]